MTMQFHFDYSDIEEFGVDVQRVDVDGAIDEGMRESMETLRDYILEEIRARGLTGFTTNDNRGPGPALATEAAWEIVRAEDGTWTLRTDPRVSERAFYLEFGTSSPITPNSADRLKFENQDGKTIYPKSVEGVEEYRFWRTAIDRFETENVLVETIQDNIEEELRQAFAG